MEKADVAQEAGRREAGPFLDPSALKRGYAKTAFLQGWLP
jgi:hypothetical protein